MFPCLLLAYLNAWYKPLELDFPRLNFPSSTRHVLVVASCEDLRDRVYTVLEITSDRDADNCSLEISYDISPQDL